MQMQWAELDSYTVDYTKPYIGSRRWRYLYPVGKHRGGRRLGWRAGATGPWTRSYPFRQIEMAVNRVGDDPCPVLPRSAPRGGTHPSCARRSACTRRAPRSRCTSSQTTGTIEVGKKADVIVLDRDVEHVALKEVSTTNVLLTMLDGVAIHRSKHL